MNEIQKLKNELGEIIFSINTESNLHNESFIFQDVKYCAIEMNLKDIPIIEIQMLKAKELHKGFGSKLITNFLEKYKNEYIIILKAEPIYSSEEDYDKACDNGEFDKSLDKLVKFYEKNNFIDINKFVDYQSGGAFIYNNKFGKQIANNLNNK